MGSRGQRDRDTEKGCQKPVLQQKTTDECHCGYVLQTQQYILLGAQSCWEGDEHVAHAPERHDLFYIFILYYGHVCGS